MCKSILTFLKKKSWACAHILQKYFARKIQWKLLHWLSTAQICSRVETLWQRLHISRAFLCLLLQQQKHHGDWGSRTAARRSRKAGKPGPKTSYRKVKTSPSRRGHIHNTQLRRCCLLTITFNRDTRRKSLMEKDEESHRHSRQEIVWMTTVTTGREETHLNI